MFDLGRYFLLSEVQTVQIDEESKEYGACSFFVKNKSILFRYAKITPTKIGQFVTCWKRSKQGPIMPFEESDTFDYLIICVQSKDNQQGCFVFPRQVLIGKGIVSSGHKEGKRGIRVYPIWDIADNKQAIKTQQWQLLYFTELKNTALENQKIIHTLLGLI